MKSKQGTDCRLLIAGVETMKINVKTLVLNISLVCMLALCVFSPLYRYQKMVLILGCFLLWFLGTMQIDIHWVKQAIPSLAYLGVMLFLYLWRGIAMGDVVSSVNLMINQMPLYLWFVILEFYLYSKIPTKTVIVAFFTLFLITVYFTIVGNLENPDASRTLATTLTYYAEQREQYRAAFIGGFDIVYGAVFLAMPLTLLARRHKWIWGIITALFVMVVISSYTTALIFIIFMIICGVTKVKNIWSLALIFGVVFLLAKIFEQDILDWVNDLAEDLGSEILAKRVTSLLTGEYVSEFGDNSNRLTIYYNTILNWLDHPIFGNLMTEVKEYRRSGHSTLLDYLEEFGLFSIVFYAYLKRYYVVVKQSLSSEYGKMFGVYFVLVVLFGLINRFDTALAFGVCTFFVAPALFVIADRERTRQ